MRKVSVDTILFKTCVADTILFVAAGGRWHVLRSDAELKQSCSAESEYSAVYIYTDSSATFPSLSSLVSGVNQKSQGVNQ